MTKRQEERIEKLETRVRIWKNKYMEQRIYMNEINKLIIESTPSEHKA